MDTIKITANGQDVSFTTKALTINDEEFQYTGISAIKHSSAKHIYLFKYEGTWHNLYYQEEDAQKIAAIFKRIAEMNAKRSKAQPPAEDTAKAAAPAPADVAEPASEPAAEPADAAEPQASEAPADETASEAPADETSSEAPADETSSEETEDEKTVVKKKKLKKSLIIFLIIIAVFIAAGVAYFFILGPANDSSHNGNTNSTHQYDDIEELIDEMQE